jgi:hypothetical protein
MTKFQHTPRLATPGIRLNQDLLPHRWERVRRQLRDEPSIDRTAPTVRSPLVIHETIESLEHALFEPGDTMLDFMVLATALTHQFAERHVRLTPAGRDYAVHFVAGQWAIPVSRRRKRDDSSARTGPRPETPTNRKRSAPQAHDAGAQAAALDLAPAATHMVDQLAPRPFEYVFQSLCGCRIAMDIPDNPLPDS